MDTKQGKGYLTFNDLKEFSIWKFNDVDDLMYPIITKEDSPDDIFDLRIRTKFYTEFGLELLGYMVGFGDIYCIAIFAGDKKFHFNRNCPEYYEKNLNEMSDILGKKLTLSNFSPLKYVTDIDFPGIENFDGEFDLLKKVTNEERLKRFEGRM